MPLLGFCEPFREYALRAKTAFYTASIWNVHLTVDVTGSIEIAAQWAMHMHAVGIILLWFNIMHYSSTFFMVPIPVKILMYL